MILFTRRCEYWHRPPESVIPQRWTARRARGQRNSPKLSVIQYLKRCFLKMVAKTAGLKSTYAAKSFTAKYLRSTAREASRSASRTKERFTQLVTS
jgi:hypothetical protein